MGILRISDIMSRNPVSVSPDLDLVEAARLMKRMHIRSLLVKDGGRFVGIITGTDLASRVLEEDLDKAVRVGEIMSSPMITIDQEEPIHRANAEMIRHHVRHLVVTDNGDPVGVVSARDLLLPEEQVPGSIPFWPHHLLKEVVAAFLMIGLMVALVWVSPAPMLPQADPFLTPEHIKPEWYFLAAYQFLKFAEVFRPLGEWAPKLLGVGLMGVVAFLLLFFPFFDLNPDRDPRRRPIAITVGVGCTLAFVAFTVWGYYS
ncbi:MAG: CBS domain-containing protein [Nitrospirota bacterium]|nr:CBS domain-containing protein [Nitrospirota bacterium]